jgi:hypothetical protein
VPFIAVNTDFGTQHRAWEQLGGIILVKYNSSKIKRNSMPFPKSYI